MAWMEERLHHPLEESVPSIPPLLQPDFLRNVCFIQFPQCLLERGSTELVPTIPERVNPLLRCSSSGVGMSLLHVIQVPLHQCFLFTSCVICGFDSSLICKIPTSTIHAFNISWTSCYLYLPPHWFKHGGALKYLDRKVWTACGSHLDLIQYYWPDNYNIEFLYIKCI